MNNKSLWDIIKHIKIVTFANLFILFTTVLTMLLLPKYLSVNDFGYWQYYLMLLGYAGLLHLGYLDGLYIRNSGIDLAGLEKKEIRGQFLSFIVLELLILIIVLASISFYDVGELYVILHIAIISAFIIVARGFFLNLLQCGNYFREYAVLLALEKVLLIGLIIVSIYLQEISIKQVLIIDVSSKLITFVLTLIRFKRYFYHSNTSYAFLKQEFWANIKCGMPILFAFLVSGLTLNIVRFFVEDTWGISEFSYISMSISISHFFLIFINSISTAIFPSLTLFSKDDILINLGKFINGMRYIGLGLLLGYYPFSMLIELWLPQYKVSLLYASLLFPICYYEAKINLIFNNSFKALRLEQELFRINLIVLIFSLGFSWIYSFWRLDLVVAAIIILALTVAKSIIQERFLMKMASDSYLRNIFQESVVVMIYVYANYSIKGIKGFGVCLVIYLLHLVTSSKAIRVLINDIRRSAYNRS